MTSINYELNEEDENKLEIQYRTLIRGILEKMPFYWFSDFSMVR